MGVFTCVFVEVLIVDNQAGSHAGVCHLVAIRVRVCFLLPDSATVQFLSSGLCIWPEYLYIRTVVNTLCKEVTIKTRRTCFGSHVLMVFWRISFHGVS